MIRPAALAAALAALTLAGAAAQTDRPYAGLQTRAVKTLSQQQIDDLRAGRGMGLALAAELNGYPGPVHALELADRLALTPDQRSRAQQLYAAMKAEAIPLGERLIAEEAELDRQFADRTVTPESLAAATGRIGRTQAELRAIHLRYHLDMMEVLTPGQVRQYADLRGYAGPAGGHLHAPHAPAPRHAPN